MKTLKEVKAVVAKNREEGKFLFEGLTSSEVGLFHHSLMFGEKGEAFPEEWELSLVAD